MDLPRILEIILNFIARWAGTTLPRIVAAFIGILICIIVISAIWDRRIRVLKASFGLLAGLLLIAVALDTRILHLIVRTSHITRIRIMMSTISFIVLVITIESIRRTRLQERYALLWVATGIIILMTAFFPQLLNVIGLVFGTQYVTSVVGVLFAFLLLISFHFSIALSGFQRHQTKIAQRFAILEQRIDALSKKIHENQLQNRQEDQFHIDTIPEENVTLIPQKQPAPRTFKVRRFRGSEVAAPVIIAVAMLAVFATGLSAPQAMIGDEVTHFYMTVEQSKNLSKPNFTARIPSAWGKDEIRTYPHPFLWHYGAAVFYRISGGSFMAVQAYQALFWGQLLFAAYLLAKSRKGIETRAAILYLVVIASIPMSLIFSVTFYQDVPMTAQAVTSFYLLDKRRWLFGTFFMMFAIGLKVTAILFLPIFFGLMGYRMIKDERWMKGLFPLVVSGMILLGFITVMGWTVRTYTQSEFYPYMKIQKAYKNALEYLTPDKTGSKSPLETKKNQGDSRSDRVTLYEAKIIANHPGDLRKPENFLVYGGIVFWLVLVLGFLGFLKNRFRKPKTQNNPTETGSSAWLFLSGGSFILMSAWLLRTAPDARFFLPGIPFILLPFVEYAAKLPRQKAIIAIIVSLSILQGGHVLAKTHILRKVTPELKESIRFLKQHPPEPNRIFMYPEGNYRLFPSRHEWYLGYRLREFWRADNDARLKMLHQFGIGAVVVKKHLIAEVDPKIINLGVYPNYFVKDLRNDPRFEKIFENAGVAIFKVPRDR